MLVTFFYFYYVDYMQVNEQNPEKKLVLQAMDLGLTYRAWIPYEIRNATKCDQILGV